MVDIGKGLGTSLRMEWIGGRRLLDIYLCFVE